MACQSHSQGPSFTWWNKRHGLAKNFARLDRVLANPDWRSQSPEALVTYLPRLHSDHSPSPLGSLPSSTPIGLLEDLITGSKNMVERIKTWNRESFGNLFGRKKQLKARIHGLQCIPIHNRFHQLELLEAHLLAEYTKILIQEEIFWLQKSRVQWLQHGDRNSRFFHLSRTLDGSWVCDVSQIKDMVCAYFKILFSLEPANHTAL
ncbi:uncharacterized protein LOC120125014 [Hibiscus syriacus]|uniref:uncharacterized protein LOC120125014 n=1 Tax=Hibiscus syriacus TaxID=106335 RepID=UPI0019209D40|nr:uncharacterized protein LOC120125014 [Hibiscus syriacus]